MAYSGMNQGMAQSGRAPAWCGKNLFDRENLGNPDTHEFP